MDTHEIAIDYELFAAVDLQGFDFFDWNWCLDGKNTLSAQFRLHEAITAEYAGNALVAMSSERNACRTGVKRAVIKKEDII